MLSNTDRAWCEYIRSHRPEAPVNGLRHPNGGDICDATSNRPRLDDSPDLDQRTPAEVGEANCEGAWHLHGNPGVAPVSDDE